MSWLITPRQPVAVDPYFSSVSLLLHGNGTNGSTSIIDSSPSPKTVTAFGNAQISTAQSRFGGASIAFDGSGDRLTMPSNSSFAFGTGDFTVEAWVRQNTRSQYSSLLEIGDHLNNGIIFLLNGGSNQNGRIGIYTGNAGGFIGFQALGADPVFNHIAYVRSSGQLTCYANGIGGTPAPLTFNFTDTSTITIGSKVFGGTIYDLNGYIDDMRITKGIAIYQGSSFTPPTAPFPDA